MESVRRTASVAKNESSCRFLLTYRRVDWAPSTASKYRYFSCESESRAFLERLEGLARFGPVVARLEVLERGRWRELPELHRAESGYSQ